jgi:hypothetical protein
LCLLFRLPLLLRFRPSFLSPLLALLLLLLLLLPATRRARLPL